MSVKQVPKRKLSQAERKAIEGAIARAKRDHKRPQTAQQTIPYKNIYPDGICQSTDKLFTKTIQFQDINYQLAQNEDKTAIFEGWCDFLNFFDSSIYFQFSFLNVSTSMEKFQQSILIPDQNDAFDDIRSE